MKTRPRARESELALPVEFDVSETALVFQVAMRRQLGAMQRGSENRHGARDRSVADSLALHVDGAGGEMAFAKATGRYWAGLVDVGKAGDVGAVQVRTRREDHYDLLVRDDDADGDVFVLVTGRMPVYNVRGWIRGRDAKRAEWRKDHGGHGPAFFVPQSALHPIR